MSNEIQVGEILDHRFEITAFVVRSGMATVFKAIDRDTGRIVIIKLPHLEFEGTSKNASRLAREAAIIGKLDHPGIPKIIPVAKKSRPYVVMEYVAGETLHNLLKRKPQLPLPDVLQLGSGLCEILDHIHRRGVVHSDLKPGNIIISEDGCPHLIDFGIAKGTSSESSGTPGYMAPEQIHGDGIDARTDIYGLGAILKEIVTDNMTPQVEEIILHATAPRPSDRYSSAAAMKADLDFPEKVRVTGMYKNPREPSPWPKRMKLAAVIFSLAAAPVILFFVFLWMFERRDSSSH